MLVRGAVIFSCMLHFVFINPSKAEDICAALTAKLTTLDLSKGSEVVDSLVGKTYRKLYDECDTQDTFNGKLLPKFNGKRLKCSTDPNHVAFIRKFPDGTIVFRSKAGVDADGSPASKGQFAGSSDQPHTSLTYDGAPTEFVNAEDVSFVVVPQTKESFRASFKVDSDIRLGDLAVVMKGGRCSFGIVADEGPAYRIGEASMRVHEDLGNPQCKTPEEHPCLKLKAGGDGVGIAAGVTYIIFPGSRPVPLLSNTVSAVSAETGSKRAAAFLDQFQ
jgi:hypothetical protein